MLSENEIETKVNFLSSARCNHTFHKYIDITGDLIEGTLLSRILYWFAPSKDNKSKNKSKIFSRRSRHDSSNHEFRERNF